MINEFDDWTIEHFNMLLSEENHLKETDTFSEIWDKIDNDGMNYFYISMCPDDVLEAVENVSEIADHLGVVFIHVLGLDFYIATY